MFDVVPHYFVSESAEGLRLTILEYQLKKGVQVQVLNIVHAEKKWWAWYYDKAKELETLPKRVAK